MGIPDIGKGAENWKIEWSWTSMCSRLAMKVKNRYSGRYLKFWISSVKFGLGKESPVPSTKVNRKRKWSSSVRALEVDLFRLIWKTKSSAFVVPWPSRDEPLQPSYFYHLSNWPCDIQTETSLNLIQSNHQPPVACCHCQEWLHRTAAQGLFCVTFWDPFHDQTDE